MLIWAIGLLIVIGHLAFTLRRWLIDGIARIRTNRHGWTNQSELQFFREEEPATFWAIVAVYAVVHVLAAFIITVSFGPFGKP